MSWPSRRSFLTACVAASTTPLYSSVASTTQSDAIVWDETFGESDYQLQGVTPTPSGDVLLVGRTGSSNQDSVWLTTVDSDGNVRWEKTIDSRGFPRFEDAAPMRDGFIFAGTSGAAGDTPWILATDETGETRWEWFGDPKALPRRVTRLDETYAITGHRGDLARTDTETTGWVRLVDSDGDPIFDETVPAAHLGAIASFGDSYAAVGASRRSMTDTQRDSHDTQFWLAALSGEGAVERETQWGGAGGEAATGIEVLDDGFLVGGWTRSPAGIESHLGLLERTDESGTRIWRRTYDVQSIVGLQPHRDGFVFTGEPPGDSSGRDPEKPVLFVDRWGRVTNQVTITKGVAQPIGLVRFGDGDLALGGWSDTGPWLTKIRPPT